MTNTYLDVLCYRSKTLADGTSPILLRLTRNGKRKYVSLGLSTDPKFWDFNKSAPKRNCPNKDAINTIIERKSAFYRAMITEKTDYIFHILNRHLHRTETQKRDRIHKSMKATNKALKKIGEKLGLPIDLTTYVARHTYATVLKRSGVETAIISESLGHSSEKVTQIYLDSFENTQIDEAMKNLL